MKKTTKTRDLILSLLLAAAVCALLGWYQADTSAHSYAISIIERSAIYAVVAVAMNLLNGFTGLFSLGQAGFMAIGAYVTAVLTIRVEVRPSVYYMNGIEGWLANLSLPMIPAMVVGGLFARRCRRPYRHSGSAAEKRLPGHCHPGLFRKLSGPSWRAPVMDRITNGSYGTEQYSWLFQYFSAHSHRGGVHRPDGAAD